MKADLGFDQWFEFRIGFAVEQPEANRCNARSRASFGLEDRNVASSVFSKTIVWF
jgi:hypothetical protein